MPDGSLDRAGALGAGKISTSIAMKKASKCRAYAAQCRKFAKLMNEHHREQTLGMARIWEAMASDIEESTWLKTALAEGYVRQRSAQN